MRWCRWNTPIITTAILLATLAVWRAGAQNSVAPTNVRFATVDLPRIFDSLDERPIREAQLKSFIEEQNAMIKALGEKLEQVRSDVDLLVIGSDERRRKEEEAARLNVDLEVQRRWAEQLTDRRRAEVFANLFNKIEAASAQVSQQRGFDLVLSNDAGAEVAPTTEAQARAMMGGRRILYASPNVDITDAVVKQMNNEWSAGKPN